MSTSLTNIQPFQAAWWLGNPHLQTLFPALLRRPPALVRIRERLELPDGDFVDLDWYGEHALPLVILLHGLTGSSASPYILGLQQALLRQGFASVAMNFRGCSGEPNRLARCYHSDDSEDLDHLYHQLRRRYPTRPLSVVGFSLGGNVLLKWLGETTQPLQLFAAAAVSVPLVLSECASRLDRGFSRLYRNHLLAELKDYVANKLAYLQQQGFEVEAEKLRRLGDLSSIRSFWEYDDRVVAPLHGYADVHDYYRRASSRPYLPYIRVPTLVIQAADDPFMTAAVLPAADELSPSTRLLLLPKGGHVGFIDQHRRPQSRYWLDHCIPAFFCQQLSQP